MLIKNNDLIAMIYFYALIPNQIQFVFTCASMIYAVLKLYNKIRAIQELIPRTALVMTHIVLLILNTILQMGYYVF
jgi:hypothetical protein